MHVQDVLPRDAIPSIDDPAFGPEHFGNPGDEVVVLEPEDAPARAYPVRVLSYHEVVNDTVGGRPVAVTWCPICASAAVYDRRVSGRTLTFGVSGKLADDALVMYDRETGTEWKQPSGTAIAGPLEGSELVVLPAPVTTWGRFRESFPDGEVLQPVREGDPQAAYDMAPYERYDAAEGFGLREMRGQGPERHWDRGDLDAKATVLGVVHDGEAVGYPLPVVEHAGGLVTDSVGGLEVLVVAAAGLQAFEAPAFDVELRDGRLQGDGTTWDPVTGESTDGRRLSRVPARRLYAFAWQDDHGPDGFYGL